MALKWTLGIECIKMIPPPNRICQNQVEGVPTHPEENAMLDREEANPLPVRIAQVWTLHWHQITTTQRAANGANHHSTGHADR